MSSDWRFRIASNAELEAAFNLDTQGPPGYSLGTFWRKISDEGFSALAAKASAGQNLENCLCAFLFDMDDKHSFNARFIQTRYTCMVMKLKHAQGVAFSELEFRF